MTVKISANTWLQELIIESNNGKVKVSVDFGGNLRIDGEENLEALGMTANDALALFLDRAANEATKARYANYGSRKK